MGEVLHRDGNPALGRRPGTPQVELLRGMPKRVKR